MSRRAAAGERGSTDAPPVSSARPRVERVLFMTFAAVRSVHIAQGFACLASARQAYRRPRLAAALDAAAVAELAYLTKRTLRLGEYDARCARLDTAFGLVGLVALALATEPADRTATLNWMLPLSVGSVIGSASLPNLPEGLATSTVLGLTYAATTHESVQEGGGRSATALANALSYPGFFTVATLAVRTLRRMAGDLDSARQLAVEQGARAAAEAARNHEHRLLHDSALQTLEALANGMVSGDADVRRQAQREALRLRRALAGESVTPGGLLERLEGLVDEFAGRGLVVELVPDDLGDEPAEAELEALAEAAREALTNVVKHAGVSRAVVRVTAEGSGVKVIVRDQGRGFDTEATAGGFGLAHSVADRMAEVGGSSNVSSSPGGGTRVELSVGT